MPWMVRWGFIIALVGITSMIACAIASFTITYQQYMIWIVSSSAVCVIGSILIFGEMVYDYCICEKRMVAIAPAPTDPNEPV